MSVKDIVEYWMDYHSFSCNNDCLSLAVPDLGLSSAAKAGIVVVVLLVVLPVIAGLIFCRRRIYKQAPQNVSMTANLPR